MTDKDIEGFVDAMISGDVEAFSKPEYEELAVMAATIYAKSATPSDRKKSATLDKKDADKVLDLIMANGCATEDLRLSLSRLAKAAGFIGFKVLTPFAAYATYKIFPHLSKEFKNGKQGKPAHKNGREER